VKRQVPETCFACIFGDSEGYTRGKWDTFGRIQRAKARFKRLNGAVVSKNENGKGPKTGGEGQVPQIKEPENTEVRRERQASKEEPEEGEIPDPQAEESKLLEENRKETTTKVYRSIEIPMAREAMEEVMKAVKAEDTKPLAFLGFANTYRNDPSPYIVEGLVKMATRHSDLIPGVTAQLLAVAMKESDVKRAVNEYYAEKRGAGGRAQSQKIETEMKEALAQELHITIRDRVGDAVKASKLLSEAQDETRGVTLSREVKMDKVKDFVQKIWDQNWRMRDEDSVTSMTYDKEPTRKELLERRAAVADLLQDDDSEVEVQEVYRLTERQFGLVVEQIWDYVMFKASVMRSLGFFSHAEVKGMNAVNEEEAWEIQQYLEEMWKPSSFEEIRRRTKTSVKEVVEPEQRKPPDKVVERADNKRVMTNKLRQELRKMRNVRAQATTYVIEALLRIYAVEEGMKQMELDLHNSQKTMELLKFGHP
jgi:hypothetical protein